VVDLFCDALVSVELPPIPTVWTPQPVDIGVVVLPVPGPRGPAGTSGAGVTFTQTEPATVWTIEHGLHRMIVSVEVYSLDYEIQWSEVVVQPLNEDIIRLSFDDPTSGTALIL